MGNLNKEDCITLLQQIYNGNIQSSFSLIQQYCIEKEKDIQKTNILLQFLVLNNNLLDNIINYVIDYYETKFNIIKIYNNNNQLIKIY